MVMGTQHGPKRFLSTEADPAPSQLIISVADQQVGSTPIEKVGAGENR